jgi:hypothetical protein
MRIAANIILAGTVALTGCSTSVSFQDWQSLQRVRLENSHKPRSLEESFAEVLANAPGLTVLPGDVVGFEAPLVDQQKPEKPQEPRHLDQRLPKAVGFGPRSYRYAWQPLSVALDYGIGDVKVRADGTIFDDRADANFARLRLDTASGAAIHGQWWSSDPDLFSGQFMNDGVEPKLANAKLGGVDVFPHVRLDNVSDDWSIPIRVGVFGDWQQLDHQVASVEREWMSFGARVLMEPSWVLHSSEDSSIRLFARIGGDVGMAWFSDSYRNGNDEDVMPRWAGELGAGLRGEFGRWHADLGYSLQHTMYGETDGALLGSPNRTELQRQQFYLGFGMTF